MFYAWRKRKKAVRVVAARELRRCRFAPPQGNVLTREGRPVGKALKSNAELNAILEERLAGLPIEKFELCPEDPFGWKILPVVAKPEWMERVSEFICGIEAELRSLYDLASPPERRSLE